MTDERERERALDLLLKWFGHTQPSSTGGKQHKDYEKSGVPAAVNFREILRDCVAVPRDELEKLRTSDAAVGMAALGSIELIPRAELGALRKENERGKRALFFLMRWRQNEDAPQIARDVDVFMREIGFIERDDNNTQDWWTDAAHEFAAKMKEKP